MGVDSGDSSEVVSKYDIYTNYSEWSETKSSGASEEGGDNVVGGGLGGGWFIRSGEQKSDL